MDYEAKGKSLGEIIFRDQAATLFHPHPIEGWFSGLKRAFGQYKTGFGDIRWLARDAEFVGQTLFVNAATLGAHHQGELFSLSRRLGRLMVEYAPGRVGLGVEATIRRWSSPVYEPWYQVNSHG